MAPQKALSTSRSVTDWAGLAKDKKAESKAIISVRCQAERLILRATVCVRVKHIAINRNHYAQNATDRYGANGLLYNIHSPKNPETAEAFPGHLAILQAIRSMEQVSIFLVKHILTYGLSTILQPEISCNL